MNTGDSVRKEAFVVFGAAATKQLWDCSFRDCETFSSHSVTGTADSKLNGGSVQTASRISEQQQTPHPGTAEVAIITGAARRIGREIAMAMVARGLAVVVHHGRSAVQANELVQQIQTSGGRALAVAADLSEPVSAAATIFQAASELGQVTTLINSASVFQDRALTDVDLDHCQLHLSVNLLAPLFLAQQFARQLTAGQRGHVINLLDWRAERPGADHVVYTASKAALCSVTRSLAQQLAPTIQVNGISPGAILPPEDRQQWHQQRAENTIPLRRTGSPKDLIHAIQFLLDAEFITGEILHVSGGEEL
jgi:pteridine reductase